MVYHVSSNNELQELLGRRALVLLLIYSSQTPVGRYASGLADTLARTIEPVISLAKMDISDDVKLSSEYNVAHTDPIFRLYYQGKLLWEQIGLFMNYGGDKYAIRRGILRALRKKGITPSSIGLRLV